MRLTTVFDKCAKKYADSSEQQPRTALKQFEDAPTDEEGEQHECKYGQSKFHWRAL